MKTFQRAWQAAKKEKKKSHIQFILQLKGLMHLSKGYLQSLAVGFIFSFYLLIKVGVSQEVLSLTSSSFLIFYFIAALYMG